MSIDRTDNGYDLQTITLVNVNEAVPVQARIAIIWMSLTVIECYNLTFFYHTLVRAVLTPCTAHDVQLTTQKAWQGLREQPHNLVNRPEPFASRVAQRSKIYQFYLANKHSKLYIYICVCDKIDVLQLSSFTNIFLMCYAIIFLVLT